MKSLVILVIFLSIATNYVNCATTDKLECYDCSEGASDDDMKCSKNPGRTKKVPIFCHFFFREMANLRSFIRPHLTMSTRVEFGL